MKSFGFLNPFCTTKSDRLIVKETFLNFWRRWQNVIKIGISISLFIFLFRQIPEIQSQIKCHHEKVQRIEDNNPIQGVEELMDEAAKIADAHNCHEERALA